MGQRRLEKALQRFSQEAGGRDYAVQVDWKPFQIDPGTNPSGEEFEAYNRRRWGSSGWTQHLRQEGRADGAMFADWRWWPNTAKAHQWVAYLRDRCNISTDKANMILFQAVYEQGKNISGTETLVQLAQQSFPDNLEDNWETLRNFLEQDEGAKEVQREIRQGSQQYGIRGVPFFMIGPDHDPDRRPYGLSGAQSPSTLLGVLQDVVQEMEEDA